MEVQRVSSDIISTLPQDIKEMILTLLPLRDALRTSILARKWRYCWVRIPEVIFDDELFKGSSDSEQIMKHKLANAIFQVLLLRTSPLMEFTLDTKFEMSYEIDQIILYLSSSNTLKSFTLATNLANHYKLPSLFFSLQGLEELDLSNCDIKLPLTFNGFWVRLFHVKITVEMLTLLLTSCTLIDTLILLGCQKDITRGNKFTFVELFDCLPSIVDLTISRCYVEFFVEGFMPPKLPLSLDRISSLSLGVSFMDQKELSSSLYLIKNSPNLVEIFFMLKIRPTSMDFLDYQDYLGIKLDHLEDLEMVDFSNFATEMEFVKLAMAKSPVLKRVRLQLHANMSIDEERRMFGDLIWLPLPRASTSAKFIIEREHI